MAVGVLFADVNLLWLIAVFIASNRIFTEGICRLCDLIIADLIDQDFVENERKVKKNKLELELFYLLWYSSLEDS